jgi:hypothetical protein
LSAWSGPFSVTTEGRSDVRRTFRSRQLIDLEHRIDALAVPVVFPVGGMQALFTMPVRKAAKAALTLFPDPTYFSRLPALRYTVLSSRLPTATTTTTTRSSKTW